MNLRQRLKEVLSVELMLEASAEEIGDDTPLFGPNGLGLDSVDALQIVVALEKHFQFKLADTSQAKQVLHSIATMAEAIEQARTPA
jgi:acyl carrier protein